MASPARAKAQAGERPALTELSREPARYDGRTPVTVQSEMHAQPVKARQYVVRTDHHIPPSAKLLEGEYTQLWVEPDLGERIAAVFMITLCVGVMIVGGILLMVSV